RRTRLRPASEREDAVDQVSPPFRGPLDLGDVPCRLAACFHLRAGHFGIAKNRRDDVIEVVGDSTGELADHLHPQRPLKPGGQVDLFTLALLALESVGSHICGEAHRIEWEIKAARWPKPVEPEDASIIARLLQHDAGPGADSEAEEYLPCVAKREPRDVARGDY